MKKIGLFLLFTIPSTFFICAQNYLTLNAQWQTIHGDIFDNFYIVSTYSIIGDSTIQGNDYHKILQKADYYQGTPGFPGGEYQFSQFEDIKLLREADKQFFQWSNNMDRFVVSFDLDIGSIVTDYNGQEVISIDTIIVEGEMRKVFNTQFGNKIYEGIGTNKGIFEGVDFLGDEAFSTLLCYFHETTSIELSTYTSDFPEVTPCDFVINDVEEKLTSTNTITIFPNPISSTINLLNKQKDYIKSIKIFNTAGQNIFSENLYSQDALISINLVERLPSGFYFLHLDKKEEIEVVKFVKE